MKGQLLAGALIVVCAVPMSGALLLAADRYDKGSDQTMGEKIDDATITSKVKMELMRNKATSALRTEVDTNGGVVTLTGRAHNQAEKELATEVAKKVKGVSRVNNQMTLDSSTGQ